MVPSFHNECSCCIWSTAWFAYILHQLLCWDLTASLCDWGPRPNIHAIGELKEHFLCKPRVCWLQLKNFKLTELILVHLWVLTFLTLWVQITQLLEVILNSQGTIKTDTYFQFSYYVHPLVLMLIVFSWRWWLASSWTVLLLISILRNVSQWTWPCNVISHFPQHLGTPKQQNMTILQALPCVSVLKGIPLQPCSLQRSFWSHWLNGPICNILTCLLRNLCLTMRKTNEECLKLVCVDTFII